jgi:hypothetical protein
LQDIVSPFHELEATKTIESDLVVFVGKYRPHHWKGNADMYVLPRACMRFGKNQLAMVFKMNLNLITHQTVAQTIGYVIAANCLLDINGRPSPVGVLSDLMDQWALIWIGKEEQIYYARMERDAKGELKDLTRETALFYVRAHLAHYNQVLRDEVKKKRKATDNFNFAFGTVEAGSLKKMKMEDEDNMLDVLESDEEIAMYEMRKRIGNTPFLQLPPAKQER